MSKNSENIKRFDLVFNKYDHGNLCVVVSDRIEVSSFNDGYASSDSILPVDLTSPSSYSSGNAYVCFDVSTQKYIVVFEHNIQKANFKDEYDAYIPYDYGTSQIKMAMSLIALSDKLRGAPVLKKMLEKCLEKLKEDE